MTLGRQAGRVKRRTAIVCSFAEEIVTESLHREGVHWFVRASAPASVHPAASPDLLPLLERLDHRRPQNRARNRVTAHLENRPNEALDPEPGVLPRAIRHRGLGALAEADAVGAAVASALELAERSSDVASLRGSDALAGPSP